MQRYRVASFEMFVHVGSDFFECCALMSYFFAFKQDITLKFTELANFHVLFAVVSLIFRNKVQNLENLQGGLI